MNEYYQRIMDSLTDEATRIIKKFASGTELTANEILFLDWYMDKLKKLDTPSLGDRITSILKYMKDNFSGFFYSYQRRYICKRV